MATKKKQKLTPKQKRLIELLPLVEAGKMTRMEAMKRAGYADSTAREQSTVMGQIGNNGAMQAALRKVNVTEERLAGEIDKELKKASGHVKKGYVELGTKLLDAMPTQRHNVEVTHPTTYAEIEKSKASSPEEAKVKAETEMW